MKFKFEEFHVNLIRIMAPKINDIAEGNSDEQAIISLAEAVSDVFSNFGCKCIPIENVMPNLSDFFEKLKNKDLSLPDKKDRDNIDDLADRINKIIDVNFSSEKNKFKFCYSMRCLIPEILNFTFENNGEKFIEVPLALLKEYEESKNVKNMRKSLKKVIEKEIKLHDLNVCIERIKEITNKLAYEIFHCQS